MQQIEPPDLSGIDQYIRQWGLATERERIGKRTSSTLQELTEFYDAVLPHLEKIILFLDQFPLKEIPPEHQSLVHITLSMIEVDQAVNKWKSPTLPQAVDPSTYISKKNFYDVEPSDFGEEA
jgi:hypothetical protein